MKITTKPGYVINRGGERLVADSKGIIETENKEAIEVLKVLFPVKEVLTPKKEVKGKSEKKK